MPKKREKKIVDNGLVPGIYNYCDRWCERCDFQLRCMSFIMGNKLKERAHAGLDELEPDDGSELSQLKDIFNSAFNVLRELAEERGVDWKGIYLSDSIGDEFLGEEYEDIEEEKKGTSVEVEREDAVRCDQIYGAFAEECSEHIHQWFKSTSMKGGEIFRTPDVEEALVEVSWYMNLMHAKIKRALYGYYIYSGKLNASQEEEDYNGSAKVVLLAIASSRKAWGVLQGKLSRFEREIAHLLVMLDQLEREMERFFPKASQFQRPGFDD